MLRLSPAVDSCPPPNRDPCCTGCVLLKSTRGCVQVLAAYPTTIRRRILRHLYLRHVRGSYIFQGCRQKFLDALLGISKVRIGDTGAAALRAR